MVLPSSKTSHECICMRHAKSALHFCATQCACLLKQAIMRMLARQLRAIHRGSVPKQASTRWAVLASLPPLYQDSL